MDVKILVPVANGTEDMEAAIIIDMLRRAGIQVKVAGENEIITCARGIKLIPDLLLESINEDDEYDAIVIPGGQQGVFNLNRNEYLLSILKKHKEKNTSKNTDKSKNLRAAMVANFDLTLIIILNK